MNSSSLSRVQNVSVRQRGWRAVARSGILAALLIMGQGRGVHAQAVLTNTNLSPNTGVQVTVNADGSYAIAVGNGTAYTPWLTSGETGLAVGQQWYSSPVITGGLPLLGPSVTSSSGTDSKLGIYNAVTQTWTAGTITYVTEFRVFTDQPVVVFEQRFPNGVGSSWYTNGVSSSFPSFQNTTAKAAALRFLTFNDGFAAPQKGTGLGNIPAVNGSYGPDPYGIEGGVPLALMDDTDPTLPTVVLSPLNNFKVGVQTRQNQLGSKLACGIQGQVQTIPAGFTHDTILYAGAGVNNTFGLWGSTLTNYYGKDRTGLAQDFTNNYLGYWTDRGSYYYYSYLNSSNAQTNLTDSTLLNIQADHLARKLPFRYYQFDSWWYYKSNGDSGGTTQWDGKTDRFPSTGSMAALNAKMATVSGATVPFEQHNRFWNSSNVYYPTYNFLIDSANGASCPNDSLFWPFLMGKAALDNNETTLDSNGIMQNDVYEQDWLQYELLKCTPLQKDVSSARNWLMSMGAAATNKGLKIQYCQALGSDYLESVEIPAVTSIRATGDYFYTSNNWNIGTTSMLAWAVGLAPFKDTFWTGASQPGAHTQIDGYGNTESNPSLQALVATLSAGPVGPGDGMGYTDSNLLMKTCRTDGLLLKPDKPATAIDRSFTTAGVPGEVWATYSDNSLQRWQYVEALGLTQSFNLLASDLGLSGSSIAYNTRTGSLSLFDSAHPLTLPATSSYDYNYEVIAPLQASGWALLGETGKFVTLSNKRFTSVADGGMTATVQGPAGETVTLTWYGPAAPAGVLADGAPLPNGSGWSYNSTTKLLTVNRTLPAGGSSTIKVILTGPAAPTGLTAAAGNGQVTLTWSPSAGASGYDIKRSQVSGGPYTVIGAVGAPSTTFTDAPVTNGVTYYYVVAASNGGIEGASSNEANATPYTNPATMILVADTSSGQERFEDIEDQLFNGFLAGGGQTFSYASTATATLTYDQAPPGGCFVGHVEARGLKPNFAYQIKLSGVPDLANPSSVTNQTNTNLGYAGRWYSDVLNNNADDNYVAAHPAEAVRGYLQMGCFVTDALGNASWSFVGDHSNHVDWRLYRGVTQTGTVTTTDVSNTGRYMLANTRPMPWLIHGGLLAGSSTTYYGYGSAPASLPATLYYEHQIDSAGGTRPDPVCLPAGSYLCNFVLTEESFHANTGTTDPNGGFWKTVLESHNSPNTNPNVNFTIGSSAASPSIGAAGASVSVTNSGGQQYTAAAKITVTDNGIQVTGPANGNGEFIGGATVSGQWNWTDPNGIAQTSSVTSTSTTTSDGVVTITNTISARAGSTVSFTVTGISRPNWVTSKPGYVWDQMQTTGAASIPAVTVPAAPTGLSASVSSGAVSLTWTASTGATSYNLLRSTISNGEVLVKSAVTGTTYSDTGLANGTTYYYKVQAVNAGGASGNSSEVAVTLAVPTTPSNLSAVTGASSGQAKLTWTDTSNNESAFYVYRSTSSGGTYTNVATLTSTTTNGTGSAITYTDSGLRSGRRYYYRVYAHDSFGNSSYVSGNGVAR